MGTYIGVKRVKAMAMSRAEYNDYRGWEMPPKESASDEGYLVEYLDSPDQNHPDHDHYISWCPKYQFEQDNKPIGNMPFGHAIEAAKRGHKIARQKWNGKGMFVVYMPALKLPPHNSQEPGAKVNDRTAKWIGEDTPLDCQPYFAMFNAQKQWIPGWLASQSDMLDDDWYIVE